MNPPRPPLPGNGAGEKLDADKPGGVLEVPTGTEIIRVRIVKVGRPTYWYAGLEGREFDCYRRGSSFVLVEDYDGDPRVPWRHVGPEDCEIVTADA